MNFIKKIEDLKLTIPIEDKQILIKLLEDIYYQGFIEGVRSDIVNRN